jgi:hypothetical protein
MYTDIIFIDMAHSNMCLMSFASTYAEGTISRRVWNDVSNPWIWMQELLNKKKGKM